MLDRPVCLLTWLVRPRLSVLHRYLSLYNERELQWTRQLRVWLVLVQPWFLGPELQLHAMQFLDGDTVQRAWYLQLRRLMHVQRGLLWWQLFRSVPL
jgi:hypothetical protein